MAYRATYDAASGLAKDWVRLNIGDRDVSDNGNNAIFSDVEINTILGEEPNKFLAAARLGEILLAQYLGSVSKSVEDLHLIVDHSKDSAYRAHITKLRERGSRDLLR